MPDPYSPPNRRAWLAAIGPALLALAGCVSSDHLARAEAPGPVFDAAAFFAGRTEGKGVLKTVVQRTTPTLVEGSGRITPDGTIMLDQSVRRGDDPATWRQWELHPEGPGRYAGTLTDAIGPVTGTVEGNRLHLRFTMKGGLRTEQWLYLQPGRAVAHNVMIVRKFGLPVARLDETIARVGG